MNHVERNVVIVGSCIAFFACAAFADGVMRPKTEGYPGELLQHISSEISVEVTGDIEETTVINHFQNDFHTSVDAVYSFPVPAGAEVTGLWYMRNGTFVEAQLKEVPQQTTPGKGEGGFAAELNAYLGTNKVNFSIKALSPGGVQSMKVRYIQRSSYRNGIVHYRFPLSSDTFRTRNLEYVSFRLTITENSMIDSLWSDFAPEAWQVSRIGTVTTAYLELSKIAAVADIGLFWRRNAAHYETDARITYNNEEKTGFVALSLYPSLTQELEPFPKHVVFLLESSVAMRGSSIQKTVAAVKKCIEQLVATDRFSIVSFSDRAQVIYDNMSPSSSVKQQVDATLDSLERSTSTHNVAIDQGLQVALARFSEKSINNMVLVFTSGNSYFSPKKIQNTVSAGIFPVVFGSPASYERMKYIAMEHNGSILGVDETIPITQEIVSFFTSIAAPVVKSLSFTWEGASCKEVYPDSKQYAIYRGSSLLLVGRFESLPTSLSFGVSGEGVAGTFSKVFTVAVDSTMYLPDNEIVRRMWAKEKIEDLERQLTIAGYDDTLKKQIVSYSLTYKVRSKYTSYWEDDSIQVFEPESKEYTTPVRNTSRARIQQTMAMKRYGTMIELTLDNVSREAKTAVVILYDIKGRIVFQKVVSLHLGTARLLLATRTKRGEILSSGNYVAVVKIGTITKRMPLMLY